MYLNKTLRDKWGLPTVTFDCGWKTNELNMRKDMMNSAAEMLEAAGLTNVTPFDDGSAPGLCIHEMGTARMGRDPKTSVLNGWNQVHTTPNVFVTDGACMTSASCVNPSLTYMALTARACDRAVTEINKRNLERPDFNSDPRRTAIGRREAIRRCTVAGMALAGSGWPSSKRPATKQRV
jgi:choline dehydrogenase-like flavoprotein